MARTVLRIVLALALGFAVSAGSCTPPGGGGPVRMGQDYTDTQKWPPGSLNQEINRYQVDISKLRTRSDNVRAGLPLDVISSGLADTPDEKARLKEYNDIQNEISWREDEVRKIRSEIFARPARLKAQQQGRSSGGSQGAGPGPESEKIGCFTPEMLVVMGDRTLKRVVDLKEGDTVLALNEDTRALVPRTVVETYEFENNHLYILNGALKVTGSHRFLTPEGWKPARDIAVGDEIASRDGFIRVTSRSRVEGDVKVYNLQVAQWHNFLVTPDGTDMFVAHNTGGGK